MVLEDFSFFIYADTKAGQPFGCGANHDEVVSLPLGQRDLAELVFEDRVSWYWFGFGFGAETFAEAKCVGFAFFQTHKKGLPAHVFGKHLLTIEVLVKSSVELEAFLGSGDPLDERDVLWLHHLAGFADVLELHLGLGRDRDALNESGGLVAGGDRVWSTAGSVLGGGGGVCGHVLVTECVSFSAK